MYFGIAITFLSVCWDIISRLTGRKSALLRKRWNKLGREVTSHNSTVMREHYTQYNIRRSKYERFTDEVFDEAYVKELVDDPRPASQARDVLRRVVKLNRKGLGAEARQLYDPAHAPFLRMLFWKFKADMRSCLIIGPESFLVECVTSKNKRCVWMLKGEKAVKLPDIRSLAASRDRRFVVMGHSDGALSINDTSSSEAEEIVDPIDLQDLIPEGLTSTEAANYELPSRFDSDHLSISNDGKRIVVCDRDFGPVLLEKVGDDWRTAFLSQYMDNEYEDYDHNSGAKYFDDAFAVISPNGKYIAMGSRCCWVSVFEITQDGKILKTGKVGHNIMDIYDYGGGACFTDDSQCVAVAATCDATGGTILADLTSLSEDSEFHPSIPLDAVTRVSAMAYLPAHMTNNGLGAFVLGGQLGQALCVSENGQVLWGFDFGSTARHIDVCPKTERILITSYSGMAHLINPKKQHNGDYITGFNTPSEEKRWIFGTKLKSPIVW